MNHYNAVGFDASDREAFRGTVSSLAVLGEREDGSLGSRLLWTDPSGAAIAVFVRDMSIVCAKPTFAGGSRLVVRPMGAMADPDGCAFCAINKVDVFDGDEMAYPLAIELDDIHLGPLPVGDDLVPIAVTAFAETITVWSDIDAYNESKASEEHPLAPRSLIPSGMFGPDGGDRPLRAEAIITGVVIDAERRTNRQSVRPFDWCRVETYAATIDLVSEARDEEFAPGQVVQGTFWLVGRRLDTPVTTHRRRFLRPRQP
ncbi:MAG: hypothetical protein QOF28_3298 [Actinomycetota bacterium]|nr:hypothetical protein [Actinomycetota bacterium]